MNLRKREPSKELAGEFKIKPRNEQQRIFDTLSRRSPSGYSPAQLENESIKIDQYIKSL